MSYNCEKAEGQMRGEEVRVKMQVQCFFQKFGIGGQGKEKVQCIFFLSQGTRTYVTAEENKLQRAQE